MTRFGLTAVVLVAGALLCSSSAKANTITINGAQNTGVVTFPPNFMFLTSGSGTVTFNGTCCPNYTVEMDVVGTPPENQGDLFSNAIPVARGSTNRIVFLWVTETGLTAPLGTDHFHSAFTANEFHGDVISVTESTYLNVPSSVSPVGSTNGNFLLGTDTFTSAGVGSADINMPTTGPFALVEFYEINTHGVGATANLTINLTTTGTTVIPEPATLALLGTGLLGIAGLRRRRGTK